MLQFFEDNTGKKSMIRLLSFLGFFLGGAMSLWGMVLTTRLVNAIVRSTESSPTAMAALGNILLIIIAGVGLAGGGEVAKIIQKQVEKKSEASNS